MSAPPGAEHAPGSHGWTSLGIPHLKLSFGVFLASDFVFFASLLATYAANRGRSLAGPFPHEKWIAAGGAEVGGVLRIFAASLGAVALLAAAWSVGMAARRFAAGERFPARLFALLTIALGAGFVGLRAHEIAVAAASGLTLSQNLFGDTFFVLIGVHMAHVVVGVLWLVLLLAIDVRRPIRSEDSLRVEICSLYWRFLALVAVAILGFVYLAPVAERSAA